MNGLIVGASSPYSKVKESEVSATLVASSTSIFNHKIYSQHIASLNEDHRCLVVVDESQFFNLEERNLSDNRAENSTKFLFPNKPNYKYLLLSADEGNPDIHIISTFNNFNIIQYAVNYTIEDKLGKYIMHVSFNKQVPYLDINCCIMFNEPCENIKYIFVNNLNQINLSTSELLQYYQIKRDLLYIIYTIYNISDLENIVNAIKNTQYDSISILGVMLKEYPLSKSSKISNLKESNNIKTKIMEFIFFGEFIRPIMISDPHLFSKINHVKIGGMKRSNHQDSRCFDLHTINICNMCRFVFCKITFDVQNERHYCHAVLNPCTKVSHKTHDEDGIMRKYKPFIQRHFSGQGITFMKYYNRNISENTFFYLKPNHVEGISFHKSDTIFFNSKIEHNRFFQAIGRICRVGNRNKNIRIYTKNDDYFAIIFIACIKYLYEDNDINMDQIKSTNITCPEECYHEHDVNGIHKDEFTEEDYNHIMENGIENIVLQMFDLF